jgi:hypothetical protein
MSDNVPLQLAYQRKWWWDPIDMEVFKNLGDAVQQQIVAISLQNNAQMLRLQADGLEKIANVMAKR